MKIVIDCRALDTHGGITAYLKECLPYFLDSPHDFLLFGNSRKISSIAHNRKNIEIVDCSIKPFSLRELLFFPVTIIKKINASDVLYLSYFNIPGNCCCKIRIPVFPTIHDVIFPDMPELTSKIGLWARMFFYRRAAHRAKAIFTVSEFSASRIRHFLGKKTPIIVTYSAVPAYLRKDAEKKYAKTKTILFVGNIKKHKGLGILLEAFTKIKSIDKKNGLEYTLIIVGGRENFRTSDTSLSRYFSECENGIVFTGAINENKLKKLYHEAALLVQPSFYEGFGLPPLEAMTVGTKVLLSDITVFKEIYADFPVTFFKTGDVADLTEKLVQLLITEKQKPPILLSETLCEKYTFKKTAQVILSTILSHLTNYEKH
ncbi:MAG: glycosyltransferase family 1 protein [Treponemataceae bacterium]|nr:MAG: glycosyltransferase family 1 protein [Treponemataceae bacterium]